LKVQKRLTCQALYENAVYDESGQLETGSFMDYCMPRADNFLPFKLETNTTLCTHNPLGAKGCGEAGTIGAPAAIMSAVVDALTPLGIVDIDMPATSERVWLAMASRCILIFPGAPDLRSATRLSQFSLSQAPVHFDSIPPLRDHRGTHGLARVLSQPDANFERRSYSFSAVPNAIQRVVLGKRCRTCERPNSLSRA
jgi:Molybdopterin-binding domain of aldehyde dehydrogenase